MQSVEPPNDEPFPHRTYLTAGPWHEPARRYALDVYEDGTVAVLPHNGDTYVLGLFLSPGASVAALLAALDCRPASGGTNASSTRTA